MAEQPPPSPGGPKRLTKSHDSKLGGVAGGLADYFDVDPTLVRVLFVIALFIPGIGGGILIAYIIMWFIMPDPEGDAPPRAAGERGGGPDATLILGIVIVALGLMLLLRTSWAWTSWFGWAAAGFVWPAILILLGAYVIYSARGRS